MSGSIPDANKRILETARRANVMLKGLTDLVLQQRDEFQQNEFYQTYSKTAVYKLPYLSKHAVDSAVAEMEEQGYVFGKKQTGTTHQYALTIQNIIDIYKHRKIQTYRDRHKGPFVLFVVNLKGGVAKTVSTVTLAHGMRAHPTLLHQDLRILVIDLDPQASGTMFLNHAYSIGDVQTTAAQAMLNHDKLTREDLLEHFVKPTIIPGVDVIPASIDDGFIASDWKELCAEHLPNIPNCDVLRQSIIDKLGDDYDIVLIDTGPHLDDFMLNAVAASNLLLTPITPAQVDFHSSMKYLTRLPEVLGKISSAGVESRLLANVGYMSRMTTKRDHQMTQSWTKDVFAGDMLDCTLPRLDGFERVGESFDTVVSANPSMYPGSPDALRKAKAAAELFSRAVYDRIELLRNVA